MVKVLSLDNWAPFQAKKEMAKKAKEARLKRSWKRDTLSEKSGVPVSTIKRYETTGEISLDQFLRIVFELGDLDKLKSVFDKEPILYATLDDMLKDSLVKKRTRGSQ